MLTKSLKYFTNNLKSFTSLEELNLYLNANRPAQTVVYFRANWNPQCQQSDQEASKLAATYPGINVIKIDSDIAPKIAKHYSVRAEPEYVFCLHGDEIIRQIGVDFQKLEDKVTKMEKLSKEVDLSDIPEKWVEYGTGFRRYYETTIKAAYDRNYSEI